MENKNLNTQKVKVSYDDLVIDLRVQDDEGNIGVVKEFSNIHNVFVIYDKGGSGYYCLDKNCIDEKSRVRQYDALYFVNE